LDFIGVTVDSTIGRRDRARGNEREWEWGGGRGDGREGEKIFF
jgi:hypothetical protein